MKGCCGLCLPRYKRLVNSVYPPIPEDGLQKNNVSKLKFYVKSSPEKLDRIGEYFAQKIASDLSRRRDGYVVIGMEAMDQLLVSCRAQSLNLFVESFLRVIQHLLETQDPKMQLLATHSFITFTNIEEDIPSYHRRYDFFVSKFSSLSHNNASDLNTRNMLRLAGLRGIKGVIRKTVSDDLQVDIWDETHMDKIVPSLLYNLQDREVIPGFNLQTDSGNSSTPSSAAEECLRELMGKVTFGNIRSVVKPVLKHFDNHQLWDTKYPDGLAINIFRTIMDSIQSQHSYAVIQLLMTHLDDKSKLRRKSFPEATTRVRTGIARVLESIIAVAAAESIGPSVLDIINSLLRHLGNSIYNFQSEDSEDEKEFQETVINTLGEFADNLPDFQKIEIMIFIISKIPPVESKNDIRLQDILLKSLLKVSTKYRTVNISHAFPSSFLNPLLALSLSTDPNVRLTVQRIFHQLLDRHSNLSKLLQPVSLTPLPTLTMEKAYRQDLMFMRKYGHELLRHIYKNIQFENNVVDNYNAIYTTLALLCIEMNSENALTELLRLVFSIQDLTNGQAMKMKNADIHSTVAAFLHLIAHLTAIPALCTHVEQVIKTREKKASWTLPEFSQSITEDSIIAADAVNELLFDKEVIAEALRSTGHDTSTLLAPIVIVTGNVVVDAGKSMSSSDLKQIDFDIESTNSSPGTTRRQPIEKVNFRDLRKILTDSLSDEQDVREQRRAQIVLKFRRSSFAELVSRAEKNNCHLKKQLNDLFVKLPTLNPQSHELANIMGPETGFFHSANGSSDANKPSLSTLQFPDVFVY